MTLKGVVGVCCAKIDPKWMLVFCLLSMLLRTGCLSGFASALCLILCGPDSICAWESGNLGVMKTILEIPDASYRSVNTKAAGEGRSVTELVAEGLRMVLDRKAAELHRVSFPILAATHRDEPATVELFQAAELELLDHEVERFVPLMRR